MPIINNNRKDVVQELLLQVYMKLPNCLIHLTSSHGSRDELYKNRSSRKTDSQ